MKLGHDFGRTPMGHGQVLAARRCSYCGAAGTLLAWIRHVGYRCRDARACSRLARARVSG